MWRELIESSSAARDDKPQFHTPATAVEIQRAEESLGVSLPPELAELLHESNGVDTDYGSFIWSAAEIERQNVAMRGNPDFAELYMPFDCLLFFASELNSDYYGFAILQGRVDALKIFKWDHETDGRICVAFHLQSFVQRWCGDELDD